MHQFRRILAIAALSSCLCLAANAENWPRFLGPNGQGTSSSTGLPDTVSPDTATWKVGLGGTGHSSPVVWDGTVYITAADGAKRSLIALDAKDGRELWRGEQSIAPLAGHVMNSQATSTPAADETGVYALWYGDGQVVLAAHSHDGEALWERNFGALKLQHGAGGSPIVHDGLVVFTLEQEADEPGLRSTWYALDATTGETKWQIERKGGEKASSSTPCTIPGPNGETLLVFTSYFHGITAVYPEDGRIAWSAPENLNARVVSSPTLAGGMILTTCGAGSSGQQLVMTRPATRDAEAKVVRDLKERYIPYCPTGLFADGRLYLTHDRGEITCLDVETMTPIWEGRPADKSVGSAVYADGKLYRLDMKGQLAVLRAGDSYELLGVSNLGEECESTPAIADGRIFIRTLGNLYCFAGTNAS